MKYFIALLWLVFSQSAGAQTVDVKAGDHPGFTRLVLDLKATADWQFGRTEEGYALRLAGQNPRFDLASVFDDIRHDRLAAIWTDPVNGDLQIGVACACHAIPFEFRPGIIVIDLRDGPPPKKSSFETALDGADAVQLAARPQLRPRARPAVLEAMHRNASAKHLAYDWLESGIGGQPTKQVSVPLPSQAPLIDIDTTGPFKDALLLQFSKGAAQGIVQMAIPNLASRTAPNPIAPGPRIAVHIGELPGFAVATQPQLSNTLIDGGTTCIIDETLDIANWGTDEPVPSQLANSRAELIGEFDRPNPDAVIHTTKLLVFLGFGAEAGQLLEQMPVEHPDSAVWHSLAKMVDGAPDPTGPFAGMHTCDSAAALWATLAMPHLSQGEKPLTAAVLRAFSALPPHLRRSLGPDLAAKFLSLGDVAVARSIGNSAQRGMAETMPDIAVMDASIAVASGDHAEASASLVSVLPAAGPNTAATLIGLVDARLADGKGVDPDTAIALAAFVREQAGSDLEPALRRAQILALASAGDFDQAFALLPQMQNAEPDLWHLLAESRSDTAILSHAVLPTTVGLPSVAQDDRRKIAAHLMALGLADTALHWIGEVTDGSNDVDRILAAKAYLSNNDLDASLARLAGLEDSTAANLRAEVLWRKGKPKEAAEAWAAAGNSDADLRAQSWAQDWAALSRNDTSSWQVAAALVANPTSDDILKAPGPLALGQALVADSNTTRATLAALLAGVAPPQPAE